MKALASALALFLVGLTGVWLWFDATSDAVQDTAGVVAVSSLDPGSVSAVQVPGEDGAAPDDAADVAGGDTQAAQAAQEQLEAVDEVDDKVLAATVTSLRGIFDGVRLGSQTLSEDLHAAADEIAAAEKAAAEAKKAEEKAAQQPAPAPQPAPQPAPVQPAPNPGGPPGPCWDWDDDDGWEWDCDDDDDDDWDDDDWEDYWEDYYDD